MPFMFIHDLVDPNDPQGRTYKRVNTERQHAIPIGALVEHKPSGIRLFVIGYARDCDGTPLYSLSPKHPNEEGEYYRAVKRLHGYAEENLLVIKEDGWYEEE